MKNRPRLPIFAFIRIHTMKTIDTRKSRIIIVPAPWAVQESYLTHVDGEYLENMRSPQRRAEGAAWRAAVRMEAGEDVTISYNDAGAPVVSGGKWTHIGVSHTGGFAAVIFSNSRCAIDMESSGRDFSRASARFISPAEQVIPGSDDPLFNAALWCAKETLYKYSGRRELDLLEDLAVSGVDFSEGEIGGAIRRPDGQWENHTLGLFFHESLLVVFLE